ncbi:Major facilitator superfamily [Lasiodiplodia theobromae]|nr:Major facilitator superfamily [Lasiodiplodia theobromae]
MASTETAIQLNELDGRCEHTRPGDADDQVDDSRPAHEFSLPPVDGGKDAWLMLASAFFIEGLVWGFPFAFGVLQEYYSSHEPFASDSSHSATIGTVALGFMYLGSPFGLTIMQRYPRYRRPSTIAGVLLVTGSIAASSFATHIWQLIITQGIFWALGASLLYFPILIYIDEWFVRRKGLAYGTMWAGTSVAGATVPYIFTWLLSRYTFATAMRAWSIVTFAVVSVLVFFAKPRIPVSTSSSSSSHRAPRPNPISFRFALTRPFLFYQLGNIFHGLGYFIPSIYLPSYARSLGLSAAAATTPLALVNAGAFFGNIAAGVLSDALDVSAVAFGISVVAAAAIFLLWGFSGSVAVALVYVFAVVYGLSAGGFPATWTGIIRDVAKRAAARAEAEGGGGVVLETGPAFGLLGFGRGIGSIASGPLSEALLRRTLMAGGQGKIAYGSEYGVLIVFTGVAMLLGGTGFGAKRLGWM